MRIITLLPFLMIWLIAILTPHIQADSWPVDPCGRQGCFQILGQPQTTYTVPFCFHGAVDIVANENAPDKTIVRCVHTGYLYDCNIEEGRVVIILDTGVPGFIDTEELRRVKFLRTTSFG